MCPSMGNACGMHRGLDVERVRACCAQVFVVGPRFQGVKMLPPGPHMVSYNAAGAGGGGGDFAPTVSFFAHLAAQQVLVRRWDAAEELLLPMQDSEEVSEAHMTGMRLPPSLCGTAECCATVEACRRPATRRRCAALTLTRHWHPTTFCPTRAGASCLPTSPQVRVTAVRRNHRATRCEARRCWVASAHARCVKPLFQRTPAASAMRDGCVPGVLERLAPVGGNTSVTAEADPSLLAPTTQAEARLSAQLQQRLRMQGTCGAGLGHTQAQVTLRSPGHTQACMHSRTPD